MGQGSLFDTDELGVDAYNRPVVDRMPVSNGTPTSDAAARSVRGVVREQHKVILDWLDSRGDEGGTDEEIVDATGLNPNAERPRRGELAEVGRIRDSGRTRKTRSGRKATIWILGPNTN